MWMAFSDDFILALDYTDTATWTSMYCTAQLVMPIEHTSLLHQGPLAETASFATAPYTTVELKSFPGDSYFGNLCITVA
jgi:hypothetical protein